jgi:hypothetical protein
VNGCVLIILLLNQASGYIVEEYPCFAYNMTFQVMVPIGMFIVVLRSWILVAQFEISKHLQRNNAVNGGQIGSLPPLLPPSQQPQQQQQGRGALSLDALPFFVRHRWLVRPTFAARASIITFVFVFLFWLMITLAVWPGSFTHSCSVNEPKAHRTAALWVPFLWIFGGLAWLAGSIKKLTAHERDGEHYFFLYAMTCIIMTF